MFYDNHAKEYAELTVKADMSKQYTKFMAYLPTDASILDAGCGSGRDSLFFMKKGYAVTMLDASAEMCKCAERLTGQKALHMQFDEIDFEKQFDGIWACASILHLSKDELRDVTRKMIRAAKTGGYLYMSFKYGTFGGYRGDRYFTDFTEESFAEFIKQFPEIDLTEQWISSDVRPGRGDERWLNSILQKRITN